VGARAHVTDTSGAMKSRRVPLRDTEQARELRNKATPEERILWHLLSRYRPKFTRQLPIGPYKADLACRQARLIVEIDGSQHIDSAHDARRTAYLSAEGWTVIRFWNSDLHSNPDGVAEAVLLKTAECLGGTHPQPLPSREGRPRRPRFDTPL
jgi:very-short-patch-repair endonuclease